MKKQKKDKPHCERLHDGKYWWLYDELHREDGPAVILYDGTKEWYIHGNLHREDGPAVEYGYDGGPDGYERGIPNSKEYWLRGRKYTRKTYYKTLYRWKRITKEEMFINLI